MPQEVDGLSKRNFPICMKSMQEVMIYILISILYIVML